MMKVRNLSKYFYYLKQRKVHFRKKKLLLELIVFIILCTILYRFKIFSNSIQKIPVDHHSHVHGMKDYLVWSDKCKIPNFDPYDPQATKYFRRQKYDGCSSQKPMTYVLYNSITKLYTLYVDEKLKTSVASKLDCCYSKIYRCSTCKEVDFTVRFTRCTSFKKSVQIPNTTDNILVKCDSNKKQIYVNGHPMMPERTDIRDRLLFWQKKDTNKNKPINILMIGIDSISRVNLLRSMPKTAQKLYDNEWFEMSGYNKIDDNTLPNLMAILTGYNYTNVIKICDLDKARKLDNCPIIWKLFQQYGYVTAFAEDAVTINTFNLLQWGFKVQPVDYYLRPFLIAAEVRLPIRHKSGLVFCLGYQHSADYVFDYAIELATRYKNEQFFGLFWANTFSHNYFTDSSSMDTKIAEYLAKLSTRGILNESVVIFFSDHGSRYGPTRETLSGYYEERLPFMFIWLPQWIKIKYPEFVNGLIANKNRLTNPYDIHMTLKHLLELSGRATTSLPKAPDCPNCQSLLRPVAYNRSCQDIAIDDHWCTCTPYKSITSNTDLNHKLGLFVVEEINNMLHNYQNDSVRKLCKKLYLHYVVRAYQANLIEDVYPKNVGLYRLLLRTLPGKALFEATIHRNTDTEQLKISGRISRLNSYFSQSKCISDNLARLYCYC